MAIKTDTRPAAAPPEPWVCPTITRRVINIDANDLRKLDELARVCQTTHDGMISLAIERAAAYLGVE